MINAKNKKSYNHDFLKVNKYLQNFTICIKQCNIIQNNKAMVHILWLIRGCAKSQAHLELTIARSAKDMFCSRTESRRTYLNAKVSQLFLKCVFLLFEPNILLHDIVINNFNDLPF